VAKFEQERKHKIEVKITKRRKDLTTKCLSVDLGINLFKARENAQQKPMKT
jgi:hypothetical protein